MSTGSGRNLRASRGSWAQASPVRRLAGANGSRNELVGVELLAGGVSELVGLVSAEESAGGSVSELVELASVESSAGSGVSGLVAFAGVELLVGGASASAELGAVESGTDEL